MGEIDTLVIGAGLAGLTAAFRLRRVGRVVRVLEAAERIGGPVRSVRAAGHLFELGPNTVPSTAPRLGELIDDLGLRARVQLSRPVAGRRLVWRGGRLHALPEKPPQLLTCSALSPLARLRLLAEPLVPARSPDAPPETLLDFGRRRLGRGATAAFLDPFITGVFAGRLDRLGVDAAARLLDFEREHGSLFRALLAARRRSSGGGPPPLVSFADGLELLPRTLAATLDGVLEAGCAVRSIERVDAGGRDAGYRVVDEQGREHTAASVVVATPGDVAARLLRPFLPPPLAEHFASLEHPFVATVGLGYRRSDIDHPLDAFGLLIAGDSRLGMDAEPENDPGADVLGVLFPSSIFDARAPHDGVTLTVMIGGARDPEAASLDDGALVARARAAVRRLLGARGEPTATRLARWPRAIPQYPPGHIGKVAELRGALAGKGLAVAGNYLDGVGVEGAVASADGAALSLLERSRNAPLTPTLSPRQPGGEGVRIEST